MTRDIDLVIEIGVDEIETSFGHFESDYFVDRISIGKAIAQRSMFNLIHNTAIIKVDCVVLKNDEYRREEFSRRSRVSLGEFETWIVSVKICSFQNWRGQKHLNPRCNCAMLRICSMGNTISAIYGIALNS